MIDEGSDLAGKRVGGYEHGGVEDDTQHVVGHTINPEVAARPARECAGEHLGQHAQAVSLVPAERQDGSRGEA